MHWKKTFYGQGIQSLKCHSLTVCATRWRSPHRPSYSGLLCQLNHNCIQRLLLWPTQLKCNSKPREVKIKKNQDLHWAGWLSGIWFSSPWQEAAFWQIGLCRLSVAQGCMIEGLQDYLSPCGPCCLHWTDSFIRDSGEFKLADVTSCSFKPSAGFAGGWEAGNQKLHLHYLRFNN